MQTLILFVSINNWEKKKNTLKRKINKSGCKSREIDENSRSMHVYLDVDDICSTHTHIYTDGGVAGAWMSSFSDYRTIAKWIEATENAQNRADSPSFSLYLLVRSRALLMCIYLFLMRVCVVVLLPKYCVRRALGHRFVGFNFAMNDFRCCLILRGLRTTHFYDLVASILEVYCSSS